MEDTAHSREEAVRVRCVAESTSSKCLAMPDSISGANAEMLNVGD
jgi:hypothetical protein